MLSVLFLLGGVAASLIYSAFGSFAGRFVDQGAAPTEEVYHQLRAESWSVVWMNTDIGNYCANSPSVFIALFTASLWFIPFITLLIGFDQVCGDIQHRNIRYAAVRARRETIIAGKSLALWCVVSALLLVLHAIVWNIAMLRGDASFVEVGAWGLRMWAMSVIFTAAYAGLTVLVSSLTNRPILCLFIGIIAFSAMALVNFAVRTARFFSLSAPPEAGASVWQYIGYAIPDYYNMWLLTPRAPQMIGGIAILLAFGVGATAIAGWLVARKDI